MLITTRQFTTTEQLRTMIKGFEMLLGVKPDVRIMVRGISGQPSGARDNRDEIVFFPSAGHRLHKIGNRYLSVYLSDSEATLVDSTDDYVTFHAAFYLP